MFACRLSGEPLALPGNQGTRAMGSVLANKPAYVPSTPQPLESTLPHTRSCGCGKIHGQLSNVKSDFEGWGWGDINPGGGGPLFDSPDSEMSHSLPLSSRSALGEERAFKNSITGLNISAPSLLLVISNYSADKRL